MGTMKNKPGCGGCGDDCSICLVSGNYALTAISTTEATFDDGVNQFTLDGSGSFGITLGSTDSGNCGGSGFLGINSLPCQYDTVSGTNYLMTNIQSAISVSAAGNTADVFAASGTGSEYWWRDAIAIPADCDLIDITLDFADADFTPGGVLECRFRGTLRIYKP